MRLLIELIIMMIAYAVIMPVFLYIVIAVYAIIWKLVAKLMKAIYMLFANRKSVRF